jgi:hypothetical protein
MLLQYRSDRISLSSNFWTNWQVFMKPGMKIMLLKVTVLLHFLIIVIINLQVSLDSSYRLKHFKETSIKIFPKFPVSKVHSHI